MLWMLVCLDALRSYHEQQQQQQHHQIVRATRTYANARTHARNMRDLFSSDHCWRLVSDLAVCLCLPGACLCGR